MPNCSRANISNAAALVGALQVAPRLGHEQSREMRIDRVAGGALDDPRQIGRRDVQRFGVEADIVVHPVVFDREFFEFPEQQI